MNKTYNPAWFNFLIFNSSSFIFRRNVRLLFLTCCYSRSSVNQYASQFEWISIGSAVCLEIWTIYFLRGPEMWPDKEMSFGFMHPLSFNHVLQRCLWLCTFRFFSTGDPESGKNCFLFPSIFIIKSQPSSPERAHGCWKLFDMHVLFKRSCRGLVGIFPVFSVYSMAS